MSVLKGQFFKQKAAESLKDLIAEYKSKFEPKKEDRFNVKGITYEIGPPSVTQRGIEFEISSKIPQDELTSTMTLAGFFKEVQKIMKSAKKQLVAINMENIVREISEEETKSRDYVKLRYSYGDSELYDSAEIYEQVEELSKDPEAHKNVKFVPGINTLAGNLILESVGKNIYAAAKEMMDKLIEANEKVRSKMRAAAGGKGQEKKKAKV